MAQPMTNTHGAAPAKAAPPCQLSSTGEKLAGQLLAHNLTNATAISDKFGTHRRAVFKADTRSGEHVAVRAYMLGNGFDCDKAATEVIRLSSLHHPHVVQPKSLIRTPDFLCIVTEFANGGDLFRTVRRGGNCGLPAPAARFLFQQLILALEFCHSMDIYIRSINPSNLLIFWNDKGMPILKISDFRVAKDIKLQGPAQTPVVATMYTCPHMIRQAGRVRQQWEYVGPTCDVWAAVVTLFFLLTGRWPFSKEQIIAWATTPENNWTDDCVVMESVVGAGLPSEVVQLILDVFAYGREDVVVCAKGGWSIKDIIRMPWFQEDLPADFAGLTDTCRLRTQMYTQTEAYRTILVRDLLRLEPAGGDRHGCCHMQPHAGVPGADWATIEDGCDPWCAVVAAFLRWKGAQPQDVGETVFNGAPAPDAALFARLAAGGGPQVPEADLCLDFMEL